MQCRRAETADQRQVAVVDAVATVASVSRAASEWCKDWSSRGCRRWEPVPLVEGVSGSASVFCECFRCADFAVGSGNAQAGASKVGLQRGN